MFHSPLPRRHFLATGLLASTAVLLPRGLVRGMERAGLQTYSRQLWAMGGWHQFQVEAESGAVGRAALEAAANAVRDFDRSFSVFDHRTPLSRLNRSQSLQSSIEDPLVLSGVSQSLEWARRTAGAFDPTVEPLMHRWGFRDRRVQTTETGWSRDYDYNGVECDERRSLIYRESTVIRLDSGAWAKGWAAQDSVSAALSAGAWSAMANCGGDIYRRTLGTDQQWTTQLRDPRAGRFDSALKIEHHYCAVATSANYESNRLTTGGNVVGHLMDPRSGAPCASDILSATVFGNDGFATDAVASALFVMGLRDATRWLASQPEFVAVLLTNRWPDGDDAVVTRGDVRVTRL